MPEANLFVNLSWSYFSYFLLNSTTVLVNSSVSTWVEQHRDCSVRLQNCTAWAMRKWVVKWLVPEWRSQILQGQRLLSLRHVAESLSECVCRENSTRDQLPGLAPLLSHLPLQSAGYASCVSGMYFVGLFAFKCLCFMHICSYCFSLIFKKVET